METKYHFVVLLPARDKCQFSLIYKTLNPRNEYHFKRRLASLTNSNDQNSFIRKKIKFVTKLPYYVLFSIKSNFERNLLNTSSWKSLLNFSEYLTCCEVKAE